MYTLRQCTNAANSGCNILGLSGLLVVGTGGGNIALGSSEDMAGNRNRPDGIGTH